MGCREFYAQDYEEVGRRLCLWWYRQFSLPDEAGVCLHDLFEWDGCSALWFSDAPVMHPETGTFPRLMIAIRALELFQRGELDRIQIYDNEPGLAALFRANGIPCQLILPPGPAITSSGTYEKLLRGWIQFYRWYVEGKIWRILHPRQHSFGQRNTLFYSVFLNEWWLPGNGSHRYHADLLEELHATGIVQEARPFVPITPPGRINPKVWNSFINHSINSMKGFYAPAFTSLRAMMKARRWKESVCERMVRWRKNPPLDFGCWGQWKLHNLLDEQLSQAIRTAAPMVVQYEALKTAFRKARPRVLLLKDEVYSSGRMLVAAARNAGVRTVSVQHGSIYPAHWCYLMDREAQGLSRPPLPDILAVYGSAVSRLLVESNGMPPEILRVIGARRFRSLGQHPVSPEVTAFAGSGGKVVLLAGQLHQDMPVLYDWLFQAARDLPHLRYVIKPHPRDLVHLQSLESRCQETPNTLFFRGPLNEVLSAAMVTVSSHSTVLLESVWLGIPAVSVQISGETPGEWQTSAGILQVVRTYADLLQSLSQAAAGTLVDDSQRAMADVYLEEYLGRSLCEDSEALRNLFSI